MAISNPHHSLLQQIHDVVNSDPKLNPIKAQCLQGIAIEPHYHVQKADFSGNPDSSPIGGHAGINHTNIRIANLFFWPSMPP